MWLVRLLCVVLDGRLGYWGEEREELNLNNYWVPLS